MSSPEPKRLGEADRDHWRRVFELFTEALARPPAERAAVLDAAAPDPAVRSEVVSLLEAHEGFGPLDRMVSVMAPLRLEALADSSPPPSGSVGQSTERRPSLEAGRRLGRYVIGSPLGSGGMGEVYRAFDTRLRREVAVKVVARRIEKRPAALERLEQEARAASALNHPNIITVFDIAEEAGTPYIVMELIEGESLRRHLSGPLPLDSLLDLGEQMASGLAAAHARQIVHRDLKPENLLLSGQGILKILDFGLAQLHEGPEPAAEAAATADQGLSQEGALLGTLGYMSPELISRQPADARSDQFSLGAILYEMASGRRAFAGRTPVETLALTLGGDPGPLSATRPDLPPAFIAVVERCLQKARDDRYASTREPYEQLRGLRRRRTRPGTVPSVLRAGATTPARRDRARPGWRMGLALLACVLMVATAASLWQRPHGGANAVPVRLVPLTYGEGSDAAPSFSPDGESFVFASDRGGNWDLWRGQVKGGVPVRITDTPEIEGQPAWSPDGTRVAFTRRRMDDTMFDILVMPAGGGAGRRITERAMDPAWSSDGRSLAFAQYVNGWVRIARIDADGDQPPVPVTAVEVNHFHRRPAWTPDGRTLVFNRSPGGYVGQLMRVPSGGGNPQPLTDDPPGTANIAATVTSDGRHVVHVSDRGGALNLWRIPVGGGAAERITSGRGQDLDPSVSSDGRRIAFVSNPQAFRLLRVSLATGEATVLGSFEGSEPWAPDLSPDGSLAVFSEKVAGRPWRLTTVAVVGGRPWPILDGLPDVFGARFLPDGTALAFDTRRAGGGRIGTVSTDGTGLSWTTPEDEDATHPDVSPDGRLVAYVRARHSEVEIVVRSLSGGPPRVVVSDATLPRFSPDGRRLAFARSRSYEGGLGVVDLQEGQPRLLTTSGSWPRWMPDAHTIAFADGSSDGAQTAWAVDDRGGPPRRLGAFRWHGQSLPFAVSKDGKSLITTDSAQTKSTLWLAEF